MSFTYHGGRLGAARAAYGGGPWLDLSTGINPHAWPGAATMAVDWRALPDETALAALEAAAAAWFGVAPAFVCAVPGSEIGLRMTGAIIGGEAAHVVPSYRTHGEMVAGSRPIALDDVAGATETIILANPGNPEGNAIAPAQLAGLLRDTRWLVVDEAFADAMPGTSIAPLVAENRRLLLFRSFGKFFGLAGVRLGFVVGPRAVIARFRDRLGGWPVSTAALAIGTAAYRDAGWCAAMRARLPAEAAALDAVLARHRLTARGACPLFRLIETDDAGALFERLARRAILTRPFDHAPGWLRIGLPGSDAALARLDRVLADG